MHHWGTERPADRAAIADALGAEGFALNRYRLPSDGGLPSGLHTHLDQEEVFVVLSGELRFETLEGAVIVETGEAVRFAPGEYQTGSNAGEETAVVLAVGAPRESEAVRVPLDCPDCGEMGLEPGWDERREAVLLRCPSCGGEHRTEGCPDCGRDELRVAPAGSGETLVRCPDCGAERAEPAWK